MIIKQNFCFLLIFAWCVQANCALVPTKSLSDPLELNRALAASLAPQVNLVLKGLSAYFLVTLRAKMANLNNLYLI